MALQKLNIIIGYILLLAGLLLIVVPFYQTYAIFTGKSLPPQIFETQKIQENKNVGAFDVQKQMENVFMKILPLDLINNTLNLGAWMILAWGLMLGGGKIASIGISLIKLPHYE